eukprot:GEMP01005115.1.p1 GENE.GEMP01005115.1~~GEMP01005115.1.p1  ORF type:complete len:516 (+),score=105.40 GEMP01005115.1:1431-2978(+)
MALPSSLNPSTSPLNSSDCLDPLTDPPMGEPLHRWSPLHTSSPPLPHPQLLLGDLLELPPRTIPVQSFTAPQLLDPQQHEVAATARPLVPWTGCHRQGPMEHRAEHPCVSMFVPPPTREMPQHPRVIHTRDAEHVLRTQLSNMVAMNNSAIQSQRGKFGHQPGVASEPPWETEAWMGMSKWLSMKGESRVSAECGVEDHNPASRDASNHGAYESTNGNDSVAQDREAPKKGSADALLSTSDNAVRGPKVHFVKTAHPRETGDVQVKAGNPMTREDWVRTHRCIDRAYDSLSSIERIDERLSLNATRGDVRARLKADRDTAVAQLEAVLDPIDHGFVFRACASHKGKRLLGRVARVVRPAFLASMMTAIFNTPTVVAGIASAADDSTSVWCGLWDALAANLDLTKCHAADADLVAHLSLLKCGARLFQRIAQAQVDPLIDTICTRLPELHASMFAGTASPRLHSVAPQHLSSVDDLWHTLGMLGEAANAEQKMRIRSIIGPFARSVNSAHGAPTKN